MSKLQYLSADACAVEVMPGYHGRFIHGANLTVAHWYIEAGNKVPVHSHPHEQIVNCITGILEVQIGDEIVVLKPGDSVVVSSGVNHSATAQTDARCIDVFYPARDDYRL